MHELMHVGLYSLTYLCSKVFFQENIAIWFCCVETVGFVMLQKSLLETRARAGASPPVCTVLPAEYSVPTALLTHSQRV